jgi:site-specific DNA-methyltransferase (adenine-specific)
MGQKWDGGDVSFRIETWREVWRVLKPGAHLAAFGGTRTFHRMAVAIEDAGFEIRDTLAWLYGTGFPKSHDVARAVDKHLDARGTGGDYQPNYGNAVFGRGMGGGRTETDYQAATAAAAWQGWGTALKPGFEPIILARKPLDGTVASNTLTHGTGALNIDGCRVPHAGKAGSWGSGRRPGGFGNVGADKGDAEPCGRRSESGRWPANVLHDGSDEVAAAFAEFGTAARFFYAAKASAADRAGSKHPTVKPQALMRWLVRLITPPGGTVLDPFGGSGSTLTAAHAEGFSALTVEREPEYQADILRRIEAAEAADLTGLLA